MDDDDLLAGRNIDHSAAPVHAKPSLYGWDNTRADLAEIKDLLNATLSVTARSTKPLTPWPRPDTAYQRSEKAWRKANTSHLNKLLGID